MWSIYLDQNIWVGLKDAVFGRPGGERFAGLPELCQQAVDEQRCRFVLSYSHYEETQRRPPVNDRMELARVMLSLSRGHTMCMPQEIIRFEIRAALFDVLELDGKSAVETPFGTGADHAVGFPLIERGLASMDIPAADRGWATEYLEFGALVGPDVDLRDLPIDHGVPDRANNANYVDHRVDLAARMKSWSRDRDRADRFTKATELIEILTIIDEVGKPLGASSPDIIALGLEGLERFLSLLPMHSIVAHLHRASLLSDRQWQLNDHNDVVYLSSAAAYCDVVVGERHWTSKLKERTCPTRAGHVLSSPAELNTLLGRLVNERDPVS